VCVPDVIGALAVWRLKKKQKKSLIAVFEHPPGHTGILAGNWHVSPRMLGKPRLRAARCANDQRHRSLWKEYMLDTVTFEGQITSF